jgi:acylphosphatase
MSVKMRISGRVQGVFFRAWAAEQARALGLSGWVRNRADGSVELLAAGEPEKVDKLIALCREGPPAAQVEHLAIEHVTERPPTSFQVRATV